MFIYRKGGIPLVYIFLTNSTRCSILSSLMDYFIILSKIGATAVLDISSAVQTP